MADQQLSLRDYGCLLLELALLWLVAWLYQLDTRHQLPTALGIAVVGFAIHAQLPPRLRLPWFLSVSVASLLVVLGIVHAAAVLGLGAVLITTATATLTLQVRLLVLAAIAGGVIWFQDRIPMPVWATLGSIFMFRLVSYVVCVRQERTKAPRVMTWSYFFLQPNAFFLLFPVVDYSTFCQSYYSSERRRIYQSGVHWIAIGVGELLLYRLIKNEFLTDPLEIRTLRSLAAFLALNYGLYVYVSGTFHIICGILHLFGFDLPRTHNNFFLAASFTDIWRRINIYWKDFLMRVCFLPAFYALRSRGAQLAIVLAVLWVFFWTWLAHAWQQFWLLGVFPLRLYEALLWGIAGAAVAVNSVLDYRRSKRRRPERNAVAAGAIQGFKIAMVFSCVSIFWGHWTHPELSQLMVAAIFERVANPTGPAWLMISTLDVVVLTSFVAIAMLVGALWSIVRNSAIRQSQGPRGPFAEVGFDRSVALHVAPLALVLVLSPISESPLFGTKMTGVVTRLKSEQVTRGEALAAVNGYYEQLSEGSVHAGPLLQASPAGHRHEIYIFGEMTRRRSDILEFDLIPGWSGSYGGAPLTINRWGMRDRDRTVEKPAGTVRIALVGSSVVMGAGVRDHETFSRLLEDQLNAEYGQSGQHFEVLNFGMGQTSAIHRRAQIQRRVVKFSPDVILYFAHQDELDAPLQRMATAIENHVDVEDDCLANLIRSLEIPRDSAEVFIFAKVNEVLDKVLNCTYLAMADAARSAESKLLFVYLPLPSTEETPFNPDRLMTIAKKAGLTTADLSTWAEGRSPGEVLVSIRDHHPGPLGHELIAARVKELLLQEPLNIAHPKRAASDNPRVP